MNSVNEVMRKGVALLGRKDARDEENGSVKSISRREVTSLQESKTGRQVTGWMETGMKRGKV